jgi:uncharacterized protein YjbI with pentapeptide repeats
MHIENEHFQVRLKKPANWSDNFFQYCVFSGFDEDGAHIDSNFVDCAFEDCDFYWAMFNVATLVGVVFKNCEFRGSSFSSCRIVECKFENCRFLADNLGGMCSFDDSQWYGCKQRDTAGLGNELASVEKTP